MESSTSRPTAFSQQPDNNSTVMMNKIVRKFTRLASFPAGSCRMLFVLAVGFCLAATDAQAVIMELGRAGSYSVLSTNVGTRGAQIGIGSEATTITGNVGLGGYSYGSAIKATIRGNLMVDATSTTSIHSDLRVTGSTTLGANLSGAVADAFAASNFFSSLSASQTYTNIGGSFTFNGTDGRNVIALTSVDTHETLTINGSASSQFIFNISAGFILNGGTIQLSGGVTADNVLFNFNGAGDGVILNKPVGVAFGIFLAPERDIILDKATLTGAVIGGGNGNKLVIHSGATLIGVVPEMSSVWPIGGLFAAIGISVCLRRRKVVA